MESNRKSKRAGRPKLPNGTTLGASIHVRLHPEEKDALEIAATKAGMKLSAWARKTLTQAAKRVTKN